MSYLISIWQYFESHAFAILSTLFALGAGKVIMNFLTGEAASAFVKAELEKLRAEMHQNSVLSQIKADDAIIDILETTIPEVLHDSGEVLKQAIADGSLDKVDWSKFAKDLWAKVEPQIVGGANDYLKNSSWADGEALAAMVLKRFFKTQAVRDHGLI